MSQKNNKKDDGKNERMICRELMEAKQKHWGGL